MAVGKIAEFDMEKDNWSTYIDRLEQYFIANSVKSEVRVATLITVIGNGAYELMSSLCTPEKPATKTYTELVSMMKGHLNPRPSLLAERFKFRQRLQSQGESIAMYASELKKLCKDCGFTAENLKENLRDQFVCGLVNEVIRQKLFTEDDNSITFDRALKIALAMEAAAMNAALVTPAVSTGTLHRLEYGSITSTKRLPVSGTRGSCGSTSGGLSEVGGDANGRKSGGRQRFAGYNIGRSKSECNVCGGKHKSATCKFKIYVCRICNKEGHLKRMCPQVGKLNNIEEQGDASVFVSRGDSSSDEVIIDVKRLSITKFKPIIITLNVHGRDLAMECDTGSPISCISYQLYEKLFSDLPIEPCRLVLRYYTGELVHPVGVIRPIVKYRDTNKSLDLYVIKNGNSVLLGRQWLGELNIIVSAVQNSQMYYNNASDVEFNFKEFSSRYCEVFADGLGCFTGAPVTLHVRAGARPVFMRARPLAYALRVPVERVLEQHVRDGILTPLERSDWATPIVPVVKRDGNIRICADFKVTLNKVLETDRYPLPRVEDLLVRLHGGKRFSKIDLSQAYSQLVLDDSSKKYTVINTHKGLFRYNRLVFGLSSSPGIFQRHLEEMFADLSRVGVFLDDVIITGETTEEHFRNLHIVFSRLEKYGLRVKKEKCDFFKNSITYLGHIISQDGIHTCPDKIKAIKDTPAPCNISELRSFIGMVMYYSKFVKNVSSILAPLYNLLKVGSKYVWSAKCQNAFELVKTRLASSEVLVHYSSELPLVLTADASSVGVGCVLTHLTSDGERPVAYASRSLTAAERHYSQIDREALAIIFGVRKFHQYVYGRKFILRTDHKPLTHIFGNKVGIPVMAASRLQRWAVQLSGYFYDIQYVASKKNCADALSRLPLSEVGRRGGREVTYLNFVEDFLPVTHDDVKKATAKDVELSRILFYIKSGWPVDCVDDMKAYYSRRNELYVEGDCIMWGYRIVVPASLRQLILKQLHISHMGIVKMKSWARSYVWWPLIDADVENLCRACDTCACESSAPPHAQLSPWPYWSQPWTRLHIDFLGPFKGKTFLILIDSTSKWLEAFEMRQTNADAVIKVLRATFARFGLPLEVASDQGPPFTSSEFFLFLQRNGIRQVFSPVYHPSSNGAAENAVKLCKRAIKKAVRDNVDLDAALQTFLLIYRNTVHNTTGETPAMLLQKRSLRSRLDLLCIERKVADRVRKAQETQTRLAGGETRDFFSGDKVWTRGYGSQDKWLKGSVIDKEGSRRFIVETNGQIVKRHVDQIRRRTSGLADVTPSGDTRINISMDRGGTALAAVPHIPTVVADENRESLMPNESGSGTCQSVSSSVPQTVVPNISSPAPQPLVPITESRPVRLRKPVVRYGFEGD